jgi:hypothetical protein
MDLMKIHTKFKSQKIISLEIVFDSVDHIKEVRSGVFSFIDGKFKEVKECKWFFNIDEAFESLGNELPYVITFSGSGIVTKKVENYNAEINILTQAIPNIEIDQFYYSSVIEEGSQWVSLVRKDSIETILNEIKQLDIRMVHFFLGPIQMNCQIKTVLGIEMSKVLTPEYIITFNDETVVYDHNIQSEDGQVSIMGQVYDGRYISLISGALTFLIDIQGEGSIPQNIIDTKIEEGFKNASAKVLAWGVGILFVLTISNFFIGSYLSDRYADISQSQSDRVLAENELKSIQLELGQKKDFFESLGMGKNNGYSFYLDQIGLTVPRRIRLLSLNINPIVGKVKNGQKMMLSPQIVLISGLVDNESTFNIWIKILTGLKWVKTVEIVDYEPVSKSDKHKFNIKVGV